MIGIYVLINNKNNNWYIGSSINIIRRIKEHFYELKNNKHFNKRLQNSYNKYKNFYAIIIEKCKKKDLEYREQYWMEYYESYNDYNIDEPERQIISDETKRKHSLLQLGEKNHNYGKKHSEETRKKMSIAKLGKKHPLYGKHHSEGTKKKMSIAKSGKKHSKISRKKMSIAKLGEKNHMYGKHHSKKTKEKISIAYKLRKIS